MREKLTIQHDGNVNMDFETEEIDTFSALLPCQRFRIRASVMSNKDVQLTLEFGLRFLKTIDSASIEDIKDFFGFGTKDTLLFLEDLLQPGLAYGDEDGRFRLSEAGLDLFPHTDPERPQMIQVEDIDEAVGFDLISFSMAGKRPLAPYHRALEELPISDRNRVSKGRETAKEAFQRSFAEFREARWRDAARSIYSIEDAEPEERFLAEVSVPIVVRASAGCVVEPDFRELRELGRPGSRDPVIASIARHLHMLAWPEDASASFDLIALCDEGTMSRFRIGGKLDPAVWIKFVMANRPPREEVSPIKYLFGSNVSPRVEEALKVWLPSLEFAERDPGNPYIWLRPQVPTWGRSAAFHELASELGGDGLGIVLLAPSGDLRFESKALRRAYGPRDRQTSPFSGAFLMPQQSLPNSLEVLIDPGRWALVLIHVGADGDLKMPIPVGFLAANPGMVAKIQATICDSLPHTDSWQLLWSPAENTQKFSAHDILHLLRTPS